MNTRLEQLHQMRAILIRAEACLRQGQVIYAYRHMGYLRPLLLDQFQISSYHRIVARLKKGEQIDAHDEIKSLVDRILNEIKRIESQTEKPMPDAGCPKP